MKLVAEIYAIFPVFLSVYGKCFPILKERNEKMLQREINIAVNQNSIEASSDWAGTSGDHKNTVLVFDIKEKEFINSEYVYKLQLNNFYALLDLEGDRLRFEIPQAVLFEAEILQIQLTISHDEEQVYVSGILDFCVSPNLCTDAVEIKYDGLLDDGIRNFNAALSEFEKLCGNFPYIDEETLTWWVFDGKEDKYVDTGVRAAWEMEELPEKFVKPENLSFYEHEVQYMQILPLCDKFWGGINDQGNIDEIIMDCYTYVLESNDYIQNEVVCTEYCKEAVFVNSGGLYRISLNNGNSKFTLAPQYSKCYIVVTFGNDSKAKAWYESAGKKEKYMFTDEGFKKAVINCINEN